MSNDPVARYFNYLAQAFPVMCASDEFHFLPRVQAAAERYGQLEDMGANRMAECIHDLTRFREEFLAMAEKSEHRESRIDYQTLALSAGAALAELETAESWRLNPLLYLKTACIGLDHALNKPAPALAGDKGERGERISRAQPRLAALPRLLAQAEANLTSISASHRIAGPAMVADARCYLREIEAQWPDKNARLSPYLIQAHEALERFGFFIGALPARPENTEQGLSLKSTLRDVFGTRRTPEEIFHIASLDRETHLAELARLARDLATTASPTRGGGRPWLELHLAHDPPDTKGLATEALYQREIERLRRFFLEQVFPDQYRDMPLTLAHTPTYLLSVRSSASFGAAFSRDPREMSYFYVTPGDLSGRSQEASGNLDRRFRREVKFLTAHETYPGHHLLDAVRRFLPDPVASQMENAVFYEGWAYFGEGLLEEYGYVDDPNDLITHHKRCLWRAVRCMADVGQAAGLLKPEEAVTLLGEMGFSREEALGQLHRFRLNPGYQVCYTLGRYEITRLYKKFGQGDLGGFCRALLSCGQLPFHLVEQRLEAQYSPMGDPT